MEAKQNLCNNLLRYCNAIWTHKHLVGKGQGRRNWGVGGGGMTCMVAKLKERGNNGKKERVLKQKLLKACHQGQNCTALTILECVEFNIFLIGQPWLSTTLFEFHGPSPLKLISPALVKAHSTILAKSILTSLDKWLSDRLRTKWFCVRIPLQSLELQISRLFE